VKGGICSRVRGEEEDTMQKKKTRIKEKTDDKGE
jgi:hypothetical protein